MRLVTTLLTATIVMAGYASDAFASAADTTDIDRQLQNLAEELVTQRKEVESLSTELELRKSELKDRMRSLASQKADLEREIKRVETKLAEVRQEIEEKNAEIARKRVSQSSLTPVVQGKIAALREYIGKSLPFKMAERLAELEKVEEMLNKGDLQPEKALAKLWSMLEDEIRLTRETGLYRQNITLNGTEQLAEVAKIGSLFMYFKTFDDEVGKIIPTDSGWEYVLAADREEEKRIWKIIDSLTKHIREGFYEFPNPYAASGAEVTP